MLLINERIDLSRKLKFFPSNSPSSSNNAYLGHTVNISPPFVDEETGLWTISLKIPVHDHNNISIGFFIKNLNLREFSEKIRGRLHREGVIFSLIDDNYRVIFQSKNNPYDLKSIFYIELFEEIRQRQSPLDDNFSFVKDTQFLYFKGLKSYPYMILTGINYSEFYMEVKQSIILQFIYILISLFSFILILLFFSYKKQCSFSCFQAVIKNYYFQFSVGSILDHIRGFSHPNESLLRIKNDKYPPFFSY